MSDSSTENDVGVRLAVGMIGAALVVTAALTFHFGWTFTAVWTSGGTFFGLGWVFQAAFWALRQVPATAWAVLLGLLGVILVKGAVRPSAPHAPVTQSELAPIRPGGTKAS